MLEYPAVLRGQSRTHTERWCGGQAGSVTKQTQTHTFLSHILPRPVSDLWEGHPSQIIDQHRGCSVGHVPHATSAGRTQLVPTHPAGACRHTQRGGPKGINPPQSSTGGGGGACGHLSESPPGTLAGMAKRQRIKSLDKEKTVTNSPTNGPSVSCPRHLICICRHGFNIPSVEINGRH